MMSNNVLVDSCVLIDLCDDKNPFHEQSEKILNVCRKNEMGLFFNPVIYGELSYGFETMEEVNNFFSSLNILEISLNRKIMFLAGKAFKKYKKNKGKKNSLLSDFVIGATAEYHSMLLLTRDKGNFKTYFPNVVLLEP